MGVIGTAAVVMCPKKSVLPVTYTYTHSNVKNFTLLWVLDETRLHIHNVTFSTNISPFESRSHSTSHSESLKHFWGYKFFAKNIKVRTVNSYPLNLCNFNS